MKKKIKKIINELHETTYDRQDAAAKFHHLHRKTFGKTTYVFVHFITFSFMIADNNV